jgi:hypothetical protein
VIKWRADFNAFRVNLLCNKPSLFISEACLLLHLFD